MNMPKMSPQEVHAFFKAHWTVRKYREHVMPPEHLDVILYAAQRAPTDATAQMYSFIHLTDPALRAEIARLSNNAHIATASAAFVVCGDVHRLWNILRSRSFEPGRFPGIAVHFAIGDAVMAGENMLLAAEMLGYRGCWIGGVMNALEEISQRLALPKGVFPFAALTLGVPDEPAQERPRLPREQVVHENHYRDPADEELSRAIDEMAPITLQKNWAGTLARYFGKGGSMEVREELLQNYLRGRFEPEGES